MPTPSPSSWPIHEYEKSILAMAYFPHLTPDSASRRLRRHISRCRGLLQALSEVGYAPAAHAFSPRQVEILFAFYGEP